MSTFSGLLVSVRDSDCLQIATSDISFNAGKTFSAEATSEHVKRPLYVVGAGELGITAAKLDEALTQVFEIAAGWNAIVLIDEADVFLEQRSLHELDRNAMVAVL